MFGGSSIHTLISTDEMERPMKNANSTNFHIEPFRHGDEVTIQRIFDGMSPESRFHRFVTAMPTLRPGFRRMLADVDGTRHRAWVAKVDHEPVGIVRVIADQFGDHELAVSVVDSMHRRGVGRSLIETAVEDAALRGIEELTLMIHPDNRASVTMFRKMGASFVFEFGLLAGRLPTRIMAVAA
jgi:acetyltransferase